MKKLISLLLALLMVLSLAACGTVEKTREIMENIAVEDELTVEEVPQEDVVPDFIHYPTTVTDQAGRSVMIPKEPERVVSGYYISTSALIALGQHDKLVGIEAKADKRPIYSLAAPELIELPNVGTAKEFDLEGCIALEPDLVILPLKLKEAAQTLEDMGIATVLVNPESGELLDEMIDILTAALNCEEMTDALTAFIDSAAADLEESLAEAQASTVYLAGNSSFLSTAPDGMYQSDLIEMAGGVNVAAEIEDTYWVEVSYEQVLDWDPQYIILASDASYTVEDVLADPALAGCAAVETGNVYQMPSAAEAWDSPVPGGILGAMWMASVIHPELVTTTAVNDTVHSYYETFYGFSYPG